MHLKSITISLALFTFRRKRFLPDHSAQSPTALFLSPAANNIQPLENCQGISVGGMTPQLYLVQGEQKWRQYSPLWRLCSTYNQLTLSTAQSHILQCACPVGGNPIGQRYNKTHVCVKFFSKHSSITLQLFSGI